ncbi:MAG: hypothetical protein UX85_C0001G0232 [Candidatus Beckwithbacteria bacterium GW2011_GWB1_47_15]|uniref:Uncharacterized protein n=1 Tax=Candidatus Beckwithbacteria bacterium GW2011_GWB1_47_15 TaxID=1618371 RepID=A0A0G1U740_9BACT|nr:MAG: hypothetical protein UY43_C0001G0893 [Candidatus Beckwithbacteria bacterium GW2011_GWC1_49_16]AQS30870.1 hypothetical protein [uncultured bacterium]KKU36054.1 MAG: hypothetical protein UX50_C0001G0231 [Candidatus Beckwithbacteria bacterium GW2011_GWA1_46_30]KKU62018.1 MAG: hypothetical protein UX85_C0001G0232 [Candidatus Beckwithbacteria bacterium GW2011_GWB1_47_15]KKU72428.1 MAG: hypothetical protein UX97_C0001G0298 [Candidatus Beckwithbacteria bacterium GW2011_GWA2_47_25]OGD49335.1 M
MYEEKTNQNLQNIGHKIGHLPEVQTPLRVAQETPWKELASTFVSYLKVIKRLATLSEKDIDVIRKVNRQLSGHGGAESFAESLGKENIGTLVALAAQTVDPNSDHYQDALNELTIMMENAQAIKKSGKTPVDGDPLSDAAIWGYTQVTDPAAQRHNIICHWLERHISHDLRPKGVKIAQKKDWLLTAMADVVALDGTRKTLANPEIFEIWTTAKPKGLGWIGQEKVTAYREALK